MNVGKAEMKMAMAQDFGRRFEERETLLRADHNRFEGAEIALKQCVAKLDSVRAFYRKEVEEGNFLEENLEMVMRCIERCAGVIISMADVSAAQKMMKQGEAQEAKRALDLVEKVYADERLKLSDALRQMEEGTMTAETTPDGVMAFRPPSPAATDLAARRAAARAAREGSVPQDASQVPETPPEPAQAQPEAVPAVVEAPGEPPTRKKRRAARA